MKDDENETGLKVVNFQKRKEEKQSEEGDHGTKYDFTYKDTKYCLEVTFYGDGTHCTYTHNVVRDIGPFKIDDKCDHGKLFVQLSPWDKIGNFFGANITVESKLGRLLPKFKEDVLADIKKSEVLRERHKSFKENLK